MKGHSVLAFLHLPLCSYITTGRSKRQGGREVVRLSTFHLSCCVLCAFRTQNSIRPNLWMTKFLGTTGNTEVTNVTFVHPLLPILCARKRQDALRNRTA